MSYHYIDVLSQAFSPRDWQVELLAAAKEKNIIICLSQTTSKHFITLKLITELGQQLRNAGKKTLLLTNHVSECFTLIEHLTDLKAINLMSVKTDEIYWERVLRCHQVVMVQPEKMLDALVCSYLDLENVNLIVLDDCHQPEMAMVCDDLIKYHYSVCEQKPKILGLAGPLHNAGCPIGRLGAELECLERTLQCQAETASDIVTVLRYSSRPREIILQCAPAEDTEATDYLRNLILTRKSFINDHRYDPTEIYEGEEFVEELKAIPDPKVDPLKCLDDYLLVLEELGVWCADKACLSLLIRIEKLKVKTPYERHFLLLCMVGTTLVQARAYCDYVFQHSGKTVKENVMEFSSPKIRRLISILKLYQPTEPPTPRKHPRKLNERLKQASKEAEVMSDPEKVLDTITKLDLDQFSQNVDNISRNIETIANGLDNLKRSVTSIIEVNGIVAPVPTPTAEKNGLKSPAKSSPDRRNAANRNRNHRRKPMRARNYQNSQDSDTLCGLIFCSSEFVTRILFNLLLELTRNDPDLAYLCVQYILDKAARPTDAKQADAEHRKQEEVLKRFRMRECNLLIGTAVLEEGIDLPKCNLVIRWDPPTNYRSYVQCKGRARAYQALYIIMVAPQVQLVKRARSEYLTNKNHRHICGMIRGEPEGPEEEKEVAAGEETVDAGETASVKSELSSVDDDSDEICNYNIKCVVPEDADDDDDSDEDRVPEAELKQQTMERNTDEMIELLAQYMEIEKMLLRKCENTEPAEAELQHADKYTALVPAYNPKGEPDTAHVTLANAVSLVNKYCAKLPSDTFTKLTPLWRGARCTRGDTEMYQCTLRLPINSPIKYDILGVPMPTRILARRVTAFTACKILHLSGELDDNLQPIGKEGFKAIEPDWENFELDPMDEQIVTENAEPRPGTTKRRQYYFKRIAGAFSDCRPKAGTACFLYSISLTLQCPIPEEQNTRGRKIYPPEDAQQSFGILTLKRIPKISAFPIFTRSGEVRVALELIRADIVLDETQIGKINTFINYTFTNVLRLQKYLMLFDADAMDNCFFIVPTVKIAPAVDFARHVEVDWDFLEVIQQNVNMMPQYVSDKVRKEQPFDANRFKDAVVMPWYRNQDQPQYFYVAEICCHLSPDSLFPGENYSTFKEYYSKKYGIEIQNARQPLLDVDHTSARLNFLTPRYVNRKGVALPTSSEETKKAKRENLEQKQILVPELCTIHPFPASLWRTAVCLPCILYRINALLLADEIRKEVSHDLGLGRLEIEDNDFQWPVLDFGWSLADVLKRSREVKLKPPDELPSIEKITEPPARAETLGPVEKTTNELLDEADKKLKADNELEIGTWSNELAEYDAELNEWGLPSTLTVCSGRKGANIRYGSPTTWIGDGHTNADDQQLESYSDTDSYQSDDECDGGADGQDGVQTNYGLKIEFKSDHLAEAIESEEDILKRQKQLEIIKIIKSNRYDQETSANNGFECIDLIEASQSGCIEMHEMLFQKSMEQLKVHVRTSGMLVRHNETLTKEHCRVTAEASRVDCPMDVVSPYDLVPFVEDREPERTAFTIDELIGESKKYVNLHGPDRLIIEGTGDQFDQFNDCDKVTVDGAVKRLAIEATSYDLKIQVKSVSSVQLAASPPDVPCGPTTTFFDDVNFSFDKQPDLHHHPGPSPSVILQGLTMSNANDGINLERLETIGDSFLKYAITTYLYCTYENVHEGKLSHLRSKQVSNLNLYRLGRRKVLGESMIATKFEPHDNWLPPCYYVPKELEQALIDAKIPACYWNLADLPNIKQLSSEDIIKLVKERAEKLGFVAADGERGAEDADAEKVVAKQVFELDEKDLETFPCFIPYNLVTQHSIPDKSIADCVEALIGAYLIDCGPRGALLFMAWLGIRVLPIEDIPFDPATPRIPGSSTPFYKNGQQLQSIFGYWLPPKSPLLTYAPDPYKSLDLLLDGYDTFESIIGYTFKDRSYLLQAMTHASYTPNRLTDCYQRLEFLGDAVLDYLITRHLFEDPRQHSPGALTDLRSALVNNTIFASLAVRHNFHKYFRHLSPGLNEVIDRFVRIQNENGHVISEEYYLISEEECDEAEDVEVPKALGDVFESVAGAIFLDSNMSLDCVWKVYSDMMKPEIEQFSSSVPKSPIRELLELEPETAKFGKPEKLADGRRVRVTVEVFGKGVFRGIGRNYRIAKCTAAKCALRQLKKQGLITKKR